MSRRPSPSRQDGPDNNLLGQGVALRDYAAFNPGPSQMHWKPEQQPCLTTSPHEEAVKRARRAEVSNESHARSLKPPAMGSKPISFEDDLVAHTNVVDELVYMNANFITMVEALNEIRSSLKLRCLNLMHRGCSGGAHAAGGSSIGQAAVVLREQMRIDSRGKSGAPSNAIHMSTGVGGTTQQMNGSPRVGQEKTMSIQKFVQHDCWTEMKRSADGLLEQIDLDVVEKVSDGEVVSPKSRSTFNALRTRQDDISELRDLFLRAEEVERLEREKKSFRVWLRSLTGQQKELGIDSCIGFIIFLNAIFIGYSIDAPPSAADDIFMVDVLFSVLFIMELCLKLRLNGFRQQFCGNSSLLNIFDASLISVDTVQLLLPKLLNSTAIDLPSISLFRVLRLVRLARMLRLLRYHVFDDLIMMVGGMVGGLTTLFWAMVLYFFSIFFVSLLFREALGHKRYDNVYEYFEDVPRSMFTMFRCSFGDCVSHGGFPIFEHVELHYGSFYSFLYFVFMFSMSIGLFNVISAIFVDATLAAATAMRFRQKKARIKDDDLWATRITILVRKLAEYEDLHPPNDGSLVDIVEQIYAMDVKTDTMRSVAADPEVMRALDDLEIDPEDHEHLAVILDPDQGGSIAIIELIDGIKCLRGDPKRSDTVQTHLMLRSLRGVVQEVQAAVGQPLASSTMFPR
eukprot:TRINITY_DN11573_c0_g1_i1.p1 TRINITY_DN11573_c0_g1~~TRINITY_DN11573_c0_g1_i1.p1  ORF type:complete len:706 (-),score=129.34 TRINITY_DN11573_c0_g1_i1:968-3013(-)